MNNVDTKIVHSVLVGTIIEQKLAQSGITFERAKVQCGEAVTRRLDIYKSGYLC